MKKTIVILLTICILFSLPVGNVAAYANEPRTNDSYKCNKNIFFTYSGTISGNGISSCACTFSINHITDNTFTGSIFFEDLLIYGGMYTLPGIDEEITNGRIEYHIDSYDCSFTTSDNRIMDITVYPFEGNAAARLVRGLILDERFSLIGSIEEYYAPYFPFDEEDMKLCMTLSNLAYENNKDNQLDEAEIEPIPPLLLENIENTFNINKSTINAFNYREAFSVSYDNVDEAKNNVAYTVTSRFNEETNTTDLFVIVRGTLNDEWEGNLEITGTSYIAAKPEHENFYKAADSIKEGVNEYCKNHFASSNTAETVNLIITGHSRGAAAANIYAAQASDVANGSLVNYNIPKFKKVTAYTFACPNVIKHSTIQNNYCGNIFNFVLSEDIVPRVPLIKPEQGWGYWKYGRTYSINASDYKSQNHPSLYLINSFAPFEINMALLPWNSVNDYYNKSIPSINLTQHTTFFDYAHRLIPVFKSENNKKKIINYFHILPNAHAFPALAPVLFSGAKNAPSIVSAHSPDTYNYVINGDGNSFTGCDLYSFEQITFGSFTDNRSGNRESRNQSRENTTYNTTEVNRLTAFANLNNNNDILEWDLTDPSSWEGVTWNNNGNVTEIDFTYKWLEGTLDVSGFTSLTNLNVYANMLTSINVDNCTALTSIDCSYNTLTNGIDLSDCTALTELFCDGCNLNSIDISDLEDLEKLSCSFNNLTTLDFSANTELEHLVCCYNYLDTHRGGTLHTDLLALRNGGAYVNYYPQRVPANATFNTAELNALKAFVLSNDNNDILDWLDENDNIDTDKLQNNVLFEYDGTEYRVVAIDIAETEVTGSLNLSALTKLEELYCERTGLTSLNVNGCVSLEVLSCYGCDIETLTLPSNITSDDSPLYSLDCEYNHIDTTMFTQAIIDSITSKDDYVLEYENQKWEDDSALAAVIEFSQGLNSEDYSEESFEVLSDLLDTYEDYENYLLTQDDIDDITAEFLTAISDLEPYLKLKLSCENGTVTTVYDNETQSGNTHSILFGESVTLTATPDTNYVFDGWYEKVTKRIYSTNSTYTFPMTTNLDFEARFVKQNAAILSFTNDTGQIVAKYDFTPTEWLDITSLTDLLPDVPYKFQHTNGRWNYTESDVLTALRAGTDVTIMPIYDPSSYVYPDAPLPVDGNPVLNLTFTYDETNDVGSFIMGAGLPQNLDVESIGIAFYYKNKNRFNPDDYFLYINNNTLVSRFNNMNDSRYIVDIRRLAEKYNWCARGFVTYRENGILKIVYSNQINVSSVVQNNRNVVTSRSVIYSDNIDTIIAPDD